LVVLAVAVNFEDVAAVVTAASAKTVLVKLAVILVDVVIVL
jgi:hypothetical protein